MGEYLFYYGDKVEVQEDIFMADGKRQARKGQFGEVRDLAFNKNKHIWVKLEGNSNNCELPAWKLSIIQRNETVRIEQMNEHIQSKQAFEALNISIGDIVKVKRPGAGRIYDVLVTEIRETSVYGYRVKKDGTRYLGAMGQEDCFSVHSLIGALKELSKEKTTKFQLGEIVPLNVLRYDIYNGAGEIIKCTSKTVHVRYDSNEKPVIYSLKSFPRAVYSREEMQKQLNGEKNYSSIKLNVATEEGRKRFEELGFDVSKVVVVEDPHNR